MYLTFGLMINTSSRKLCVLLCCFAVVLVASCTGSKSDVAVVEEGKAPNFTLHDVREGKVSLSGFRGKVVLIEFWATWCPPCRESIPELNKLYDKYKDKGMAVLAVSVDKGGDAAATVGSFVKENDMHYPVLIDDGKAHLLYGVSSIPALFLVDKDGRVVKKFAGFIPGLSERLSQEIEKLL